MFRKFNPHPDETAAAYLGRLQNFNGVSSWKALHARQRHRPENRVRQEAQSTYSVIDFLADSAEMATDAFCCAHTLIPFSRSVASRHADRPHGENTNGRLHLKHGLSTPRSEQVFCEVCRRKQNQDHGYSWWQRELQLPGIYRCPTHNAILMKTVEETDFSFSPDRYAATAVPVILSPPSDNPIIDRYASLARLMLQTTYPMSTQEAAFKLGQRAKTCGLRVGNKGRRASLEDLARETLPSAWVNQFMPRLLKEDRVYQGPLQYATINMPNPITATLALALMFESVEEAWLYWQTPLSVPMPGRRQNRRYPPDFWSSERMLTLYTKHNGSAIEVAKALGIEYGHVRMCLANAGLPSLSRIHIERNGPALLNFLQGNGFDQSIAAYQADKEKLLDLLRVAAAPLMRALEKILHNTESQEVSD